MTLFSKVCAIPFLPPPFIPQWFQFAKHCIIFLKCSRLFFGLLQVYSRCCYPLQSLRLFYGTSSIPRSCLFLALTLGRGVLWFSQTLMFSVSCRWGPGVFSSVSATRENHVWNKTVAVDCLVLHSLWCAPWRQWLLAENRGCSWLGRTRNLGVGS